MLSIHKSFFFLQELLKHNDKKIFIQVLCLIYWYRNLISFPFWIVLSPLSSHLLKKLYFYHDISFSFKMKVRATMMLHGCTQTWDAFANPMLPGTHSLFTLWPITFLHLSLSQLNLSSYLWQAIFVWVELECYYHITDPLCAMAYISTDSFANTNEAFQNPPCLPPFSEFLITSIFTYLLHLILHPMSINIIFQLKHFFASLIYRP